MTEDIVPQKRCTRCGEEKPATRQYFNINNKNGKLRSMCRECHRRQLTPNAAYRQPLLPDIPDGYKCCSKCQRILPLSVEYFCKAPRYKNGLSSECRNCINIRQRKHQYARRRRLGKSEFIPANLRAMKTCPVCQKTYPRTTEFFQQDNRYGVSAYCIECEKKRGREKARFRRTLKNEFTEEQWQLCLRYFNHRCAVCGKPKGLWHIIAADHWIPASSPGCPGTIAENMIPLCHSIKDGEGGCNLSKNNKLPEDWLIQRYGKRKAAEILKRIEAYFEWIKQQ